MMLEDTETKLAVNTEKENDSIITESAGVK